MGWRNEYERKLSTPEDVLGRFMSNGVSLMVGGMFTADSILKPLLKRIQEGQYESVDIYGASLDGPYDFENLTCTPEQLRYHVLFAGTNERKGFANPCVRPFPVRYGGLNQAMERLKPRIALTTVTPPDEDGFVYLGVNGMMASALPHCTYAIGQVNRCLPRCKGKELKRHVSEFDAFVECDQPLIEYRLPPFTQEDERIAEFIAERIPDGACIQLGIGTIPNAIGEGLKGHRNLGMFSEMISGIMLELQDLGVVDNSRKNVMPGVSSVGFAMGTTDFYQALDGREDIEFLPFPEICSIANIAQNEHFVSVNSALSIDITGQVFAESIGPRHHSGTGGQLDFMIGSQLSKGGQSFIALRSTASTKDGPISKIVISPDPCSIVTTPRSCIHNVATEYGCVDLSACSVAERAERLISIAHPAFREKLTYDARKLGYLR